MMMVMVAMVVMMTMMMRDYNDDDGDDDNVDGEEEAEEDNGEDEDVNDDGGGSATSVDVRTVPLLLVMIALVHARACSKHLRAATNVDLFADYSSCHGISPLHVYVCIYVCISHRDLPQVSSC